MKKSYVKPQVYFENFQLSASIASGCGRPVYHQPTSCFTTDLPGGMGLFGGDYHCEYDADTNGYCYQTVSDTAKFFDS